MNIGYHTIFIQRLNNRLKIGKELKNIHRWAQGNGRFGYLSQTAKRRFHEHHH